MNKYKLWTLIIALGWAQSAAAQVNSNSCSPTDQNTPVNALRLVVSRHHAFDGSPSSCVRWNCADWGQGAQCLYHTTRRGYVCEYRTGNMWYQVGTWDGPVWEQQVQIRMCGETQYHTYGYMRWTQAQHNWFEFYLWDGSEAWSGTFSPASVEVL